MRTNKHSVTQELRTNAEHEFGFTLIEIVLVLSIIALLVGAGIMQLTGVGERGKITRVKADLSTLRTALELYQMDAGTFPTTEQGLKALVEKPTIGRAPESYRPYLRKPIRDPWGSPYAYAWPPQEGGDLPEIYSLGKDGADHTGDEIFQDGVDGD